MKILLASVLLAGLTLSAGTFAAPPADAPPGVTGLCKDGSYFSGAQKKGACRGHKGVKDWYADAKDDSKKDDGKQDDGKMPKAGAKKAEVKDAPAESAAVAPAPATRQAPADSAKMAPAASPAESKARETPKPAAVAAVGGGADKVWVNEGTKVYHCPGDRWYGKTKEGVYMSESDAAAKGNKPDHGRACK
jgi:hypothetical protein